MHSKKLMPWACHQMDLSPPSLEPILPSQLIVLIVPLSQVWSDGPIFHPCYETMQKIVFIAVKHRQTLDWNILMTLFLLHCEQTRHPLAHGFLIPKFSVNMRCTVLFEMPTMFASWRTFSRRLSNTILWIFFIITVVVTSFDRPLRYSSKQLVRPRLNSDVKYFIVVNDEADFPRVESSLDLILVELRSFKWKYCIT